MARSTPHRRARLALGGALTSVILSAGLIAWLWLRGPHDSVVTLAVTAGVLVVALLSLWLNLRLRRSTRMRVQPTTGSAGSTGSPSRQSQGAAWLSAIASFITAVATLLSSGATGYAVHGVQRPARTVYVTPSDAPTDAQRVGASISVPACARNAPIPVQAPRDQAGYKRIWQGCAVVDSAGLTFGVDGPQKANGDVYDIAYQPDAGGWLSYANSDEFIRWMASGRPGPAYCAAEYDATDPDPVDARDTTAVPGRWYCLLAPGSRGGPFQVVMEVYDVAHGKANAAVWQWRAGG